MIGPRDIAGTAGAGAATVDGLVHRGEYDGVLSHSQIVVGAPYRHIARSLSAVMGGLRKIAHFAFKIGKYAITPFLAQAFQLPAEIRLVVHCFLQSADGSLTELPHCSAASFFRASTKACLNRSSILFRAVSMHSPSIFTVSPQSE